MRQQALGNSPRIMHPGWFHAVGAAISRPQTRHHPTGCHCEPAPQRWRGNPYSRRPGKKETDCHVGLRPPRNDTAVRFPCVRATGRRGRRPLRHCHKISACPGKRTTARVAPTAYYRRWGGQRRQGRLRPGIRGGGPGGGGGEGGGVQGPGPQGVPGLWGDRGGGGGGKGRLGRPRRSQTASKCRRPR